MVNSKRFSVYGAALISGLCIYIPVPGIRGALFCLFPGIANRSLKIAGKGLIAGFCADIAFCIAWFFLGFVWEPRVSFNRILSDFLPPEHAIYTHSECAVPNGVQFGLGLTAWCGCMFALWLHFWPRRFSTETYFLLWHVGVLSVIIASASLWVVSPMDHWWSFGAQPSGDINSDWYVLVFLGAIPTCCLIFSAGIQIANWFADRRQ